MIRFSPKKLRDFNRQLFAESYFDEFLVPEAHFMTVFRSDFDGRSAEENESGSEEAASLPAVPCIRWGLLRPIALELVRGAAAPKSFSIVLKLPAEKIWDVLPEEGADPDAVSGLYLNIRYAKEELSVTTGCTLKAFSLDRTWEKAWDLKAEDFLNRAGLI